VIDGDTLEIHGTRIRHYGIDAPESRQTCHAADEVYGCGQQAALALADHIGRHAVSCEPKGDPDRYGRMIAICTAAGEDLSAWLVWLVEQGWVLAYRRYSIAYVGQEQEAESAGRGIWRGEFVAPWDWRKGIRSRSTAAICLRQF
jgi:endonuclease YncB( thermonuclease family)